MVYLTSPLHSQCPGKGILGEIRLLATSIPKTVESKFARGTPMSLNVLETDAHGRVVEKPVVEWTVTTDRAVTVVAAFE